MLSTTTTGRDDFCMKLGGAVLRGLQTRGDTPSTTSVSATPGVGYAISTASFGHTRKYSVIAELNCVSSHFGSLEERPRHRSYVPFQPMLVRATRFH
jgi:hypothetical protein